MRFQVCLNRKFIVWPTTWKEIALEYWLTVRLQESFSLKGIYCREPTIPILVENLLQLKQRVEVFLGYMMLSWEARKSVVCCLHVRMPACPDPIDSCCRLLSFCCGGRHVVALFCWPQIQWQGFCCSFDLLSFLELLRRLNSTLEISGCVFLAHGLF